MLDLGGFAELSLEEDPDFLLVLNGEVVNKARGKELVLELNVGDLLTTLAVEVPRENDKDEDEDEDDEKKREHDGTNEDKNTGEDLEESLAVGGIVAFERRSEEEGREERG